LGVKFTASDITLLVAQYFWPFVRIAAFVGAAPIFGTRNIPAHVKVGIAFVLAVMVVPQLPKFEYTDALSLAGIITTIQQVLIGLLLGFVVSLVFSALVIGGQSVAQLMGLGFASMMDPQNGVAVPVVGQFYTVLATFIFLATNGHLILVDTLVTSFKSMPIGDYSFLPEKMWEVVLWSKWMFIAALVIALPAITALLLVNVAFGVMTRASPQLNIFAVGFPITILLGFIAMLASMPYVVPKLQEVFEHTLFFMRHNIVGAV
jgi:flagellar biosynthetic protein FliR